MSTDIQECADCGQQDLDELYCNNPDGQSICDSCSESYVTTHSGEIIPVDEGIYIESRDEWYAEDETGTCDDCGNYEPNDALSRGYNNGAACDVCESCGEDHWLTADDTGNLIHYDNAHYSDRTDCYTEAPQNECGEYLLQYETNVLEHIGHDCYVKGHRTSLYQSRSLVFGVELETDGRHGSGDADEIAGELLNSTNFGNYGICKEDGTVSGPECVTQPADLESHKTVYKWGEWADTLRPLAKGHNAHDAGMHVHINRRAVSPLTLGKMLVFVNDKRNLPLLEMVAQRGLVGNEWCPISNADKFKKVGAAGKDPHAGKYSILNVTHSTVECRMFRANLLEARIHKNIEFCHSLVLWCRAASVKALQYTDYLAFVSSNKASYPNLHKFVTERNDEICA